MILAITAAILVPYIIGSIPTGFWIVKALKGVDIRTIGSGNIGATNVKRAAGMKWFFIVLFLDAMKGFIPVYVISLVYGDSFPYLPMIAAVFAILGHTFTIFLKFKGGKGVATGLGVFLALAPFSVLTSLAVFLVLLAAFKYISLGSISGALLLPLFVFFYGEQGYMSLILYLSLLAAVFITAKHKDNIKRLLNGTENKFTGKKEKGASK